MSGVTTIVCSESTLFVVSQYCCGLFEIANYRFTTMISDTINETDDKKRRYLVEVSMRNAVEIHTRAIDFVKIFGYDARLPYLIAIVVVVVSMSLNLYRSILAMMEMDDKRELIMAIVFGIIHVVAVFMGNYIGQEVIDNSMAIFHDLYNSLWYYCPVRTQKMVLLIMQRTITGSMLDFSGLFVPSNKGFATVHVSPSFDL
ncbi:odorant receptor 22c-like isoform X2 [Augochlora pura]